MTFCRTLLPAFGTSLAFTLGGGGERLAFQPAAGATLSKSFTLESSLELDDLSLLVSGQDIGEMIGEVSFSMNQETKIEVTDTYAASADGRPTELVRSFEALSSDTNIEVSPNPGMEMPSMAGSSELEGKAVRFKWNDEEGDYDRSFVDGEGDEALLEKLEEDMDLRVFLPQEEVAEEGTWTVELVNLDTILTPGGNLHLMPEDMEVDQDAMDRLTEIFEGFAAKYADQLEGECKCTYKGLREEGGANVAEIAIELEVAATLDLTEVFSEIIRASIEESGAGDQVQFSFDSADLSVDFEGSGTLLWNPSTGLPHSFQLSGDVTFGIDMALGIEAMGESQDVDASVELSGSVTHTVSSKQ